jgi:hypothetical protein
LSVDPTTLFDVTVFETPEKFAVIFPVGTGNSSFEFDIGKISRVGTVYVTVVYRAVPFTKWKFVTRPMYWFAEDVVDELPMRNTSVLFAMFVEFTTVTRRAPSLKSPSVVPTRVTARWHHLSYRSVGVVVMTADPPTKTDITPVVLFTDTAKSLPIEKTYGVVGTPVGVGWNWNHSTVKSPVPGRRSASFETCTFCPDWMLKDERVVLFERNT